MIPLSMAFFMGFSLLQLGGCAKSLTVSHPGAINAFDSNTADAISTAAKTIEAAKPLATTQSAKDKLNKLIDSFNLTQDAYLAYHSAVKNGGTPDTASLQALARQLSLDIAAFKKGGTP